MPTRNRIRFIVLDLPLIGNPLGNFHFADRADAGAAFSSPQNLVEINGAADEADPAISADGRELFFATSRAGSSQLWHALRSCLDP